MLPSRNNTTCKMLIKAASFFTTFSGASQGRSFIRVYFSKGEVEVGELRGRNVPLEERGKRKNVLGGRRRRFKRSKDEC